MGFQFEPERSISSHEGFCQDSSDEGSTTKRDMFVRKDWQPQCLVKVQKFLHNETEKECQCYQEVEAVCNFNLQGIFFLSQAIILSELTHNLMISISICFCNQTWLQNHYHVANVYKLSSLVAKCSILYFAGFLNPPLGK